MAVRYACDGCDKLLSEGEQPTILGNVLKREYCATCAPEAQDYMKAVSDAHTDIAKAWQEKLGAIRERYSSFSSVPSDAKPLYKLPDCN